MPTSHDMLNEKPDMTDATSIADGFSTYQRTPTHQSNFIIYPKAPATPLTSYYSTPTTSKGPNLVLNEYANRKESRTDPSIFIINKQHANQSMLKV